MWRIAPGLAISTSVRVSPGWSSQKSEFPPEVSYEDERPRRASLREASDESEDRPIIRPQSVFEYGAVVQLDDAHTAGRGRLHAQLAEHALIEVLLGDRCGAVGRLREDVYGADLSELLRQLSVAHDFWRHVDADEHRGH